MHRDATVGGRVSASQRLVYGAVFALLSLVAVLTWHARRAERSHEATVNNALGDYAEFAAWQFVRDAQSHLTNHVNASLTEVRRLRITREGPLPSVTILTDATRHCACGFRDAVLFAFRIELPNQHVTTDRTSLHDGVVPALSRLAPQLIVEAHENTPAQHRLDGLPNSGLRFAMLSDTAYALAYHTVRDQDGAPRAVYGIALPPQRVAQDLRHVFALRPLLPPSLVGQLPNDSIVRLTVEHPAIGSIFASHERPQLNDIAVHDTMELLRSGLVTTVSLRPQVTESLLLGSPSRTTVTVYLTMLAIASALALLAVLQLRRARALTQLREQFVANVSHELRTPLAQISMFSETLLLDRERSPEEGRRFLSVIYREARRLSTLVENVLRFSRGDAKRHAITPERRNLVSELRDTVSEFEPLARRGNVTLRVESCDELWARVDPGALRQILLNLLDNAVKFGPRSQTVIVRAARDNGCVKIAVEDEGPGIPVAERTRVFEPFARLTGAAHANKPGTGIGLSVVRELVHAHGGVTWIESVNAPNVETEAQGIRVGFSLPADATP